MSLIKALLFLVLILKAPLVAQEGRPAPALSDSEVLLRSAGPISSSSGRRIEVMDALVLALGNARVPGGIAYVYNCDRRPPTVVPPDKASIQQLLEKIISERPEYVWSIDHGVVNLNSLSSLTAGLDVNIGEFRIENASSREALIRLLEKPELRRGFDALNLYEGLKLSGGGFSISKTRFTLNLTNATVRQVLNAIARADGRAMWAYIVRPCSGRNEYSIDFLID